MDWEPEKPSQDCIDKEFFPAACRLPIGPCINFASLFLREGKCSWDRPYCGDSYMKIYAEKHWAIYDLWGPCCSEIFWQLNIPYFTIEFYMTIECDHILEYGKGCCLCLAVEENDEWISKVAMHSRLSHAGYAQLEKELRYNYSVLIRIICLCYMFF
jgi:hypothetical protein